MSQKKKKLTCNFHRITDVGTCGIRKTRFAVTSHCLKQVIFRGDFKVFSIDRTWLGSAERVRHEINRSGLTRYRTRNRGALIQWSFVRRAVTPATGVGSTARQVGPTRSV